MPESKRSILVLLAWSMQITRPREPQHCLSHWATASAGRARPTLRTISDCIGTNRAQRPDRRRIPSCRSRIEADETAATEQCEYGKGARHDRRWEVLTIGS